MTRRDLVIILVAFISAGAYLLLSYMRGAIGFPLDDAWIHQVYARNIATRGEFAFFADQPSAGSTSPLWALLLSLGYLLRIDFHVWSYLLGAMLIGFSAIFLSRFAQRISHPSSLLAFSFALFTLLEWHLAWSAVSGMEIPLFVFLSLILVERFYGRERAWVLGLIAGLLVLTRPEGGVLAALVGVGLLFNSPVVPLVKRSWGGSAFAKNLIQYAFGFTIFIVPYLVFNLTTSGTIFPNTFYAKNAEYAVLFQNTPFIVLWLQLLAVPWVGAQILLLPGFIFILARVVMTRDYRALIPFVWILALPLLYALRLPVAYQHGRYEMPIVPFILVYGIWGTAELFVRIKSFLIRATWKFSIAAALIAFWIVGASAYSTDVAIIDCEMVQTARWVSANVPRDALVAAHDIGALGYYYDRPFIDLAGLVSPEVIPFIRDESRLRDYLFSRQTAFVIVFSDWYDSLTHDPRFVPVYQRDCAVTRDAGSTNMTVYEILLTTRR